MDRNLNSAAAVQGTSQNRPDWMFEIKFLRWQLINPHGWTTVSKTKQ